MVAAHSNQEATLTPSADPQASVHLITLRIGAVRSPWMPTPVIERVLHVLFRACSRQERLSLPVSGWLAPLLPAWVREELGFASEFALDGDNNNQLDAQYGEAVLNATALLILNIVEKQAISLDIQVARTAMSRTDRQVLGLLCKRSNGRVMVQVVESKGSRQNRSATRRAMLAVQVEADRGSLQNGSAARRAMLAVQVEAGKGSRQHRSAARRAMLAVQRGKDRRVLATVLQGVNRAILMGLYHEALRKLRLAAWIFKQSGEQLPKELVERMALAYSALGDHPQVVRCQQWLIDQAQDGKERSSALISQAVYLYMGEPTPAVVREARRLLAGAQLQIRQMTDADERALMKSMLLNSSALLLYRRGRLQAALRKCERAYDVLAASPTCAKYAGQASIVSTNATRIALLLEDEQRAALWTERLAQQAHAYPQIAEQCSKMYGRLGRWQEAVEWAGHALEAIPSFARLYLHRALCYYHLQQQDHALADLSLAAQLAPDDERVCLLRATVLEEIGDLAGALANYKQAVTLVPSHVAAWADMARVHWLQGDCEASFSALQTAIDLAPEHTELRQLMSQLMQEAATLNSLGGDNGDSTDPFPV